VYVCVCVCVALCLCLSLSVYLCLCLFLSLYLSLFLLSACSTNIHGSGINRVMDFAPLSAQLAAPECMTVDFAQPDRALQIINCLRTLDTFRSKV
jgi:hypothetical protein